MLASPAGGPVFGLPGEIRRPAALPEHAPRHAGAVHRRRLRDPPVLRGSGQVVRHSSLHGIRIPPCVGGYAAEALRPSLPRHLRPGLVRAVGLQGAVAGETGRRAGTKTADPRRQGLSLGRYAMTLPSPWEF